MTDFEIASARYQKAKEAYWKAREELETAERERSTAFRREIEDAKSRRDPEIVREGKAKWPY